MLAVLDDRPFELLRLYGSIGLGFVAWQMVALVLWTLATVGALVLLLRLHLPAAGLSSPPDARSSALGVVVVVVLGCAYWTASGQPYLELNGAAYAHDEQDPKLFAASGRQSGRHLGLRIGLDEPATVTLRLAKHRPRSLGHFEAGRHQLTVELAHNQRVSAMRLQAEDDSGRRSPVRRITVVVERRSGRRP